MKRTSVFGGIAVLATAALGAGLLAPSDDPGAAAEPALAVTSAVVAAPAAATETLPAKAPAATVAARKVTVRVTVGTTGSRTVTTTRTRAKHLLADLGVERRAGDQVGIRPAGLLRQGSRVRVVRTATKVTTTRVAVPAPVSKRTDPRTAAGRTTVLQAGRPGIVERTLKISLRNGRAVSTTVIGSTVVRAPIAKVVRVGTKVAASRSATRSPAVGSGIDNLNWAALAKCESGGNAGIVSSNGMYYGLYQFMPSTWRAMGGSGLPNQATPAEQTYRAKLLYKSQGRSPWPYCGRFL